MGLDEALESIGRYGRYQLFTYCLVGLTSATAGTWQLFVIVFIGYINPHRCKLPGDTPVESLIPIVMSYGDRKLAGCRMYGNSSDGSNDTIACTDGYTYELDGFDANGGTITMEWDLVCDKDSYVEMTQTIFSMGVVIGFFLFTPFADRYGRKKVLFSCHFFMDVFGIILAFSPDIIVFCICQFITGMCAAGVFLQGFVLACEIFPTSAKMIMAPLTSLFATFGMLSLVLIAYIFRHWRHLQLAISVAGLPMVAYAWFCPESLRWLLANDRHDEVQAILEKAARFNNVKLPDRILDEPNIEDTKKDAPQTKNDHNRSVLALFRSPRPRRYFFVMLFMTFVNNVLYYGISLMSGALAGDVYLNFFINGILEVPAILFAVVIMKYLGRRRPMVGFQLFSSAAMLMAAISTTIQSDKVNTPMLVTAFSLTCKLGVGATYGVGLIYAQEIFPTNIRATCLGIVAGSGFIGSIIAPFSVYLFRIYNWAPGIIFGMLALVAGLLTLLLPDTYNRPLPATIEEIAGWSLTKKDNDCGSAKARESEREKDTTASTVLPAKPSQIENARMEQNGLTNVEDSIYPRDEMYNRCTGSGNMHRDSMSDASSSVIKEVTRL